MASGASEKGDDERVEGCACVHDGKGEELGGVARGSIEEGGENEVGGVAGVASEEGEGREGEWSMERLGRRALWNRTVEPLYARLVRECGEECEVIVAMGAMLEYLSRGRSYRFVEWSEMVRKMGGGRSGSRLTRGMIVPMMRIFRREVRRGDTRRGPEHAASCARFLRQAEEVGFGWEIPCEWREREFVVRLSLLARVSCEVDERDVLVGVLVDLRSKWALACWGCAREAYGRVLSSPAGESRAHVREISEARGREGG